MDDEAELQDDAGRNGNVIERRVRMKLDLILLPFLSLLFLFNSLDKSNIGSAETGHFTKDTGLPPETLNISVACFFAAFVTLQPVGAALGRKYGMARYVPTCMALWGLCTAAHIFITQPWHLIVLRTTVGVLEAGFYPTTVSYLSLFYTRFEFAKRLGLFYGQAAVAGALGGLLSWVVFSQFPDSSLPSRAPVTSNSLSAPPPTTDWKSWQVLFLIEGTTTMVIAMIGFVWLPHSADTAWFLSAEECIYAEHRIRDDHATATARGDDFKNNDGPSAIEQTSQMRRSSEDSDEITRLLPTGEMGDRMTTSLISLTDDRGLTRHDIVSAVLDWKVWYLLVCNILSAMPATAFTVFLPMVVKGLSEKPGATPNDKKMSAATANLLTVPPFLAGAVVLWSFTAWSDRRRERFVPILCGLTILIVGLTATVLLPPTANGLRYCALVVLLSGSFIPSPLTVAWLTNNMLEPGKRAIVLGINGWGNLAGVLSALLFSPRYRDSGYVVPFLVTLVGVGLSFVGFLGFRAAIVRINRQRMDTVKTWDSEQREREQLFGDVGGHRTAWVDRLYGHQREREGDERLTFIYGL